MRNKKRERFKGRLMALDIEAGFGGIQLEYTGERREPEVGEWYMWLDKGKVTACKNDPCPHGCTVSGAFEILRPIEKEEINGNIKKTKS